MQKLTLHRSCHQTSWWHPGLWYPAWTSCPVSEEYDENSWKFPYQCPCRQHGPGIPLQLLWNLVSATLSPKKEKMQIVEKPMINIKLSLSKWKHSYGPITYQLHSNNSSSNNNQLLRDFLKRESPCRGYYNVFINLPTQMVLQVGTELK